MTDQPSPSPEEATHSSAADSSTPDTSSAEPSATKTVSPGWAIAAFIIITLLGVLLFQNLMKPGLPAGKNSESPGMASLKADIETRRAELNRTRVSLGLEPIASSNMAETADEVAARLRSDASTLSALASSFEELIQKKELELDGVRQESVKALQDQKRLRELLDRTKHDLDTALIDASLATTLKNDLDQAKARIVALSQQLADSQSAPGDLQARLDTAESENTQLRQRVADLTKQLEEATIFAATESEIRKEAVQLYQALLTLEGKPDSEISTAYSRFGAKLGANVMRTCTFATGSSEVDAELQQELPRIAQEAPEGAMLFVVGYASETGNVDANRTLSSDRATAVAVLLDEAKRPGQKVQAAYLGQTDRFSSGIPERNQIVEIWEIAPAGP
ncbi:outer membrane protein OmpA-like peptidoglycan-associated protein [Haloferula luteola]|uniref:Outer membrane protein OmpA-like peptidoglycan-associated protein n=1 Tax=Haloferula luteola TaxID=595692 RepID=A0A840V1U3_9BACT|nr:OmpA family protein [Haloferula luteola]MBB5351026.1 outer membrane protein OmpA-like peptidoglycan-associated protein [Haloferula luteola]